MIHSFSFHCVRSKLVSLSTGPSDTEHTHFSTGPVAGFLVDDVGDALRVPEAEGIEFIGPVHVWEPTGEAWPHFRAPGGNVYEIIPKPKHQ
jgi:hypothetical protein